MRYDLEAKQERMGDRATLPRWWSTRTAGDGDSNERRSTPGEVTRVNLPAIVRQASARPPRGGSTDPCADSRGGAAVHPPRVDPIWHVALSGGLETAVG